MNNKSRGYLYVVCALYLAYLTYGIITDYNGEIAAPLHELMCIAFAAVTIIVFYLGIKHIKLSKAEQEKENASAGEDIHNESDDTADDSDDIENIEGIEETINVEEDTNENS